MRARVYDAMLCNLAYLLRYDSELHAAFDAFIA